jgi:tol-pal system protein YbgF
MKSNLAIAWMLPALAVCACASTAETTRRLGALEQDLIDLRRDQRRMAQRIEELQIQLTVVQKKLEQPTPPQKSSEASREPALQVVKLRPVEKSSSAKSDLPLPRVLLPPVDPNEVEERLPVDRDAARRPVLAEDEPKKPAAGGEADEKLVEAFRKAFDAYQGGDFERAISAMHSFAEKNPSHRLAPDALYYAAKAELDLGRLEAAEKKFDAVIDKYPRSSHVASAMLFKGRCSERRGNREAARGAYLQVVQSYPRSDEAAEANRRLDALR